MVFDEHDGSSLGLELFTIGDEREFKMIEFGEAFAVERVGTLFFGGIGNDCCVRVGIDGETTLVCVNTVLSVFVAVANVDDCFVLRDGGTSFVGEDKSVGDSTSVLDCAFGFNSFVSSLIGGESKSSYLCSLLTIRIEYRSVLIVVSSL